MRPMKKSFLLIICVLFGTILSAQDNAGGNLKIGGAGYFQPGGVFRMPNNMGFDLNTVLNESEDYSQIGYTLGGGGFARIGDKIILGGEGFFLYYPHF